MRTQRALTVIGAVLTLLSLAAVPASATFESHKYFYKVDNLSGHIQCAQRTSSFRAEVAGLSGVIQVKGLTDTWQHVYCGTSFVLPAGWILEANVMQRSDGYVYLRTGWHPNVSGAFWANAPSPEISWANLGYSYQGVTYHRAAILGGWQDSVWFSTWRYLTV